MPKKTSKRRPRAARPAAESKPSKAPATRKARAPREPAPASRSRRRKAARAAEMDTEDLLFADVPLEEITNEELRELEDLTGRVVAVFESVVPGPVKRILATGIGAVLLTEEGVRKSVQELRDPRDLATSLADQAGRAREGIGTAVSGELRSLLSRVENASDVRRLLDGMTLEVTMEMRFSADDESDPDAPATPRPRGIRARLKRKKKP